MAIKTSGKYKGGLPVEVHSHERPHIGGPLGDRINSASPAELKKFRSDLQKMDKQGKNVVAVRTPTGKPVLEISPKIVMQHVDSRLKGGGEAVPVGPKHGILAESPRRFASPARGNPTLPNPVGKALAKSGSPRIQTSPKGARYYVNASGNKVYVK